MIPMQLVLISKETMNVNATLDTLVMDSPVRTIMNAMEKTIVPATQLVPTQLVPTPVLVIAVTLLATTMVSTVKTIMNAKKALIPVVKMDFAQTLQVHSHVAAM